MSKNTFDPFAETVCVVPQKTTDPRSRFVFDYPWFDRNNLSTWDEQLDPFRGWKLNILEVGGFEGASTTWFLDNLMEHKETRLTVIDTFEGGMEQEDPPSFQMPAIEKRFWTNVSKCEQLSKMGMLKAKSDDALIDLRREGACFDIIYIDGSHAAIDILHDAVLCWKMLNLHGLLIFDEILWKEFSEDTQTSRGVLESFVKCIEQESEVVIDERQCWLRKVEPRAKILSHRGSIASSMSKGEAR